MANIAECTIGRTVTVIADRELLLGKIIGRRCNGVIEGEIAATNNINPVNEQGDDVVQISFSRENELNFNKYITTRYRCKPDIISLAM